MKSSFSRSFSAIAAILLLALTALGASFQILVKDYMTGTAVSGLAQDAAIIANLASAYSVDNSLTSRDFLLNLDIASQVSDSDVVICDSSGNILLCSDSLLGCEHQGMRFDAGYVQKVIKNNGDNATGVISGLYPEHRFVVSTPIPGDNGPRGIVIVSKPSAATNQILNRISNIFLTTAIFVVLISVLAVSIFARRESRPLRTMARVQTGRSVRALAVHLFFGGSRPLFLLFPYHRNYRYIPSL